jgi:magnesium chelatase family protein
LLQSAGERFGWSARAFESVLRVARTIADLAGALTVSATHVAEAAQYRRALGMD